MNCEMCGKNTTLYRTVIEDIELKVCNQCGKFGKVLGVVRSPVIGKNQEENTEEPEREIIQLIVSDYAIRIKNVREKLGMKQKEFAKFISEKESLLHKLETSIFEPSIKMARKLEKMLKIRLVEQHEEIHGSVGKKKFSKFTIGDIIKIRKR